MEGGGEKFRLTNFTGGGGGSVQDESTIINRMMLRFRPIAPKPAAGVESTGSRPLPKVRTKRKYVRVTAARRKNNKKDNNNDNNNNNSGREKEEESEAGSSSDRTLQLLPAEGGRSECEEVETWVTAEEGVVEECMERKGLVGGRVLKEDLEEDTCPVFVSDGEGKVVWVNEAYKEMVDQDENRVSKVTVRLVVAEKVRPYLESYLLPFSCWVGLKYRVNTTNSNSNSKEWKWWYMRVPCDVWKMEEDDGFAWRLDVKVALKLGL